MVAVFLMNPEWDRQQRPPGGRTSSHCHPTPLVERSTKWQRVLAKGGDGMGEGKYRVAMMFAGDPNTRATLKLEETRFGDIAKALRNVGLEVEAAVYADEVADEVREHLLRVDGVLVWVDPVRKDGDRAK